MRIARPTRLLLRFLFLVLLLRSPSGGPTVGGASHLGGGVVRVGSHRSGCHGHHGGRLLGGGLLAGEHPGDVGLHLPGRLVAVGRVLGQRLQGDGVDVGSDHRVELAGRHRRLAYVLVGHTHRGVADERRPADQQLVQQATRRVEVAAGVDGLAAGLLRREVLSGADHGCGLGHGGAGVGHGPGDAEVHHLDPAVRGRASRWPA